MNTITTPDQTTPLHYQGSIFAKSGVSAQPLPCAGAKIFGGCIGWDWLQFSAMAKVETALQGKQDLFRWEQAETGSEHFKERWVVSVRVQATDFDELDIYEKCATLEMKPRAGYIPDECCLIKLENKYCYQAYPSRFISLLTENLGLIFKNYTRLDAFIDIQKINYNGGTCQDLMLDFSAKRVVMKAKTMVVHHDRDKVTGITWGKRVSGTSVTMYNKTKHMRKQGNNKPWVAEMWHSAGFESNIDTYRLEFSQKKNLNDLIDTNTGKSLGNHSDITFVDNLTTYIRWAYTNHFQIAKYCAGVRFSRMERLNVLDINKSYCRAIRLTDKEKSTNYIKAQIKNTVTDAMQYQATDKVLSSVLFEYVEKLVSRYYLGDWFQKKFAHLELHNLNITIFDIVAMDVHKATAKSHWIKQSGLQADINANVSGLN